MVAMIRPFAVILVVGLLVGPTSTLAVTRHVPGEHSTIQAGLDASVAGDSVVVAPGIYTHVEVRDLGGPFRWTACVFMVNGVVLRSEGGPSVTAIEMDEAPGPQDQVILALAVGTEFTSIEGFAITTSLPLRGCYLEGYLTYQNCAFHDLTAGQSSGGGIAANGNLTLIGCEFENCRAFSGGAIYHANGWLEMHDTVVRDCGSVGVLSAGNYSDPPEGAYIEGCAFEGCWGTGVQFSDPYFGGATVRACRFVNNTNSTTGGGAIRKGSIGSTLVEDCLFLNNRTNGANGIGGAISIGGTATERENTFFGNSAPHADVGGGAVALSGGPHQFMNNVIAESNVPAVFAYNAVVQSVCNVFWQNVGGAGVYFTHGPTDREVDPLFCDVPGGDFHVMVGSPCLPEGSIGCGLIGAFGEGCGVVSVERQSWGKIKGAYRAPDGGQP
ncbi:MAG: right-handed parallel beta-helix repeat-containing protein [bacterium]